MSKTEQPEPEQLDRSQGRQMEQQYLGPIDGPGIGAHGGTGDSGARSAMEFAEMIVDTVREGLLVLDLDLRVEAANESFYRMFEATREETEGRLVYELGGGEWDLPALRDLLERVLPERHSFDDFEVEHAFEGVGRRVLLLNGRQLNHHQMVLLAVEDVTERKGASEALLASEARYRALFETIEQGFCVVEMIYDAAGAPVDYRFVEVNPAFERHTGLHGAVGRTALEMVPGLERHWVEVYGRVAETGQPVRFEQGSSAMGRWFEVSATRADGQESGRVALLFTDVTERKGVEEARRESEARYRALFTQAPAFIAVLRQPGHVFEFVNPAYLQLIGEREVLGRPVREALPEFEGQGIFEILDRVYENGEPFTAVDREVFIQRTPGEAAERRFIDFVYQPLREADGAVSGVIVLGVDTTERVEAREALAQAHRDLEWANSELEQRVEQRTRQVRELASTLTMAEQEERRRISQVLHDSLQQQLYGIQLKVSAARQDAAGGRLEAVARALAEAERWLGEGIETTRRLTMDLSPPILREEGLTGTLQWLAAQMHEKHELEVEIQAAHAFNTPDEDMRVLIFQLIRELLFNVVKHAGTHRAAIALRDVDHHVEIRVSDEGAGFDVAAAEARRDGGFGLFNVRERLRLFGGRMEIDSAPGAGTRVTVDVPLRLE